MTSGDEGDLIDLAGRLRQLMFDGSASLVDKVNTNNIGLTFRAGTLNDHPFLEQAIMLTLQDGIDPEIRAPTSTSIVTLTREGFSTLPVIYLQGQMITVREVVRHAALVAGGVHHDSNPREEFHSIAAASRIIQIGGLPFGIRDLMAIARVIIRGLQPLIEDVRRQLGEPAP